jgi:type IV pilus assembly protein PilB
VNAILAQRLARTVCQACKEQVPIDLESARLKGWSEEDLGFLHERGVTHAPKGKGCPACFGTGFSGRTAFFELLAVTDLIRDLIVRRASAGEIKKAALKDGFLTLRKDGLRRVAAGLTTLDEVWSVTQMDL